MKSNKNKDDEQLHSSLKLLAKTSIIVFIGVITSKILGYIYRIIIARYYGPEEYGLFSLALMISGWFIAIAALGITDGLLRFLALYRGKKEFEKVRYLFKVSFITLAITAILSGILLFFLSDYIAITFFHNPSLIIYLKIFSLVIPVTLLAQPFLAALRAHEEIASYSFIFNIAQNVMKVALLVLFLILGLSKAIAWSYLGGLSGVFILGYLICKYKVPSIFKLDKLPKHEKGMLFKELMGYSLPLLFFGVLTSIFYWIDSFSIGYYKSAVEVGIYNAAIPIVALLIIAPELFMQLFFPLILKEYGKNNLNLIKELSKQMAKWILLINIPIFALMIAFPGAVINILFGSQYLAAETSLRILAIGSLVSSVLIVSNHLISMIGKSKLILINMIIAALINLVLNSIFVPMKQIGFIENSLGINGAALATLISIVIFNLLFLIESYRYISIIPLRRKMVTVFLAAIVPTALLLYLTNHIEINILSMIVLSALFFILYLFLVVVTGCLDRNDITIIKSFWNKIFGRYKII